MGYFPVLCWYESITERVDPSPLPPVFNEKTFLVLEEDACYGFLFFCLKEKSEHT